MEGTKDLNYFDLRQIEFIKRINDAIADHEQSITSLVDQRYSIMKLMVGPHGCVSPSELSRRLGKHRTTVSALIFAYERTERFKSSREGE